MDTNYIVKKEIKLILNEESSKFQEIFQLIKKDLTLSDIYDQMSEVCHWIEDLLEYSIEFRKHEHGLIVPIATRFILEGKRDHEYEKTMELSRILGWVIELMQSMSIIAEEILVNSSERKEQIVSHKLENLDAMSICEVYLVQASAFYLVKKYFASETIYRRILDSMMEASRMSSIGASLELLGNRPGFKPDWSQFTMDRYENIVIHKYSHQSFSLPLKFALILTGISNPKIYKKVENVMLKIGHFSQVRDDFLNNFRESDHRAIKKSGVEDGKCAWPFAKALELAKEEERKSLGEHYGRKEKASIYNIRNIYKRLNIVREYRNYKLDYYRQICKLINQTCKETGLSRKIFQFFLYSIFEDLHDSKDELRDENFNYISSGNN